MKKIIIQANLSPQEEAIAIAKEIFKNPLVISSNNKFISNGNNLDIQNLNTIIQIQRIPKEPLMSICSCCDTNFEKGKGSKIFVNYGGKKKYLEYCSDKCRSILMDILPESRYSLTKTNLKNFKFF